MDLLNLFVKIGVKDEASEAVEGVSQNIIGKLAGAAATAAKALAGMFVVKKVVDFGKAAFDAYASFEQLAGGVAKLYGNAGLSIDDYAASVGKSVDEVTADYQRNAEAQALLMQNSREAWRTAGMDANTYMSSVTGFSSALINSLGGDTKKAAEIADMAMQDISDNANTFGKYTVEELTGVYQSLAKGQYQMLDNLNLGFGGTKEGLQQLIDKAEELSGVDYDASNFADIAQAIHVIQENAKITGTTQREALGTIEGSMNATKAAWQNLVAEFGKPDANIGARIADMFTAVMGENGEGGLLRNVTNEVRTIATNMINAVGDAISAGIGYISTNGPTIVSKAMDAISTALDSAISGLSKFAENFDLVGAIFGEGGAGNKLSKVGEFVGQIGDTIVQKWPEIQEKLGQLWDTLVTTFETVMPQVMEFAGRLVTMAGDAIVEHGPELLSKLGEVIGQAIGGIASFVGDMSQKGHEFMAGLISGTSEEGEALHGWFKEFFPDGLLKGLGDFGKFLLDCGKELIQGLLDGITKAAPDVGNAIKTAFDSVIGFFQGVADFIKDPVGSIEDLVASLTGTSGEAAASVDSAMDDVGTSTAGAAAQIAEYNATELENKSATADISGNAQDGKAKADIDNTNKSVKSMSGKNVKATVNGNAQDGKAKTNIDNTNKAVKNLSGKSITVSAVGNIISGVAESAIKGVKSLISNLHDKSITLTTHKKEVKEGGAWGGITPRYHATGGVRIADRWGEGVPLDVVGERGPEAIVPLTSRYGKDFARMMGAEAGKYLSGYMGGGNSYNLYYSGEQSALDMFDDLTFRMQVLEAMGD